MQLSNNSGYDEKFRAAILNLGLKGFDKIVKTERDGVRPMFRPKGWNETSRRLAKKQEDKPPLCISDPLPRVADPGKFVTEELTCKVHPADQRPLTATAS